MQDSTGNQVRKPPGRMFTGEINPVVDRAADPSPNWIVAIDMKIGCNSGCVIDSYYHPSANLNFFHIGVNNFEVKSRASRGAKFEATSVNLNLAEYRLTNVMKQSISVAGGLYWEKRLTGLQQGDRVESTRRHHLFQSRADSQQKGQPRSSHQRLQQGN
jgi:hypothetical protein